jgi:hypothetical protein
MSWRKSDGLMKQITHYANFVSQTAPSSGLDKLTVMQPATGVSLRQMVQFGARPSTGNLSSWNKKIQGAYGQQEPYSAHRNSCPRNCPYG